MLASPGLTAGRGLKRGGVAGNAGW